MQMIGHKWYTLTICILAMTIAFVAFQHYKYQQDNNQKISNIEKYIRILSSEFSDLKQELEEYDEPEIPSSEIKVSKINYNKNHDLNQDLDEEVDEEVDEDVDEKLDGDEDQIKTSKNKDHTQMVVDEAMGVDLENMDIPSEDEIKNLLQNSIFTAAASGSLGIDATVVMGDSAQIMFASNLDSLQNKTDISSIQILKK